MKPESSKGTQTKARIIRAAADLFHKQGVGSTSPDDIIEASGTGKGQFYHYFKSKEGLVHEVLQNHLHAIKSGSAPIDYEISSWESLESWFLGQIELQKKFGMKRGCPFGTIGNELRAGRTGPTGPQPDIRGHEEQAGRFLHPRESQVAAFAGCKGR